FLYMTQNAGITFTNKKVLVLGSGGTARTVQAVADDCGAKEIIVVSRTGQVNYGNVYEQTGVDIIVNATPVGMYPETENSPVELNRFPDCSGVLDVTYNPLFSRLLLQAKQLGIPFANGLTMLAAQAKYSSDLFFHQTTPLDRIDVIVNELTCRFTNIVLTGMPGSGKTTVGKLIAKQIKKIFVDTDALIEEKEGLIIPEIFEKNGEAYFRNLETQVISKIGKEKGQVISTGGGAVLRYENYLNLKQNGFIIFLQRDIKSLESKGRPLSAGFEAIEKLYEKRLPLYHAYCDMEIDCNCTPEIVAQKVLQAFVEINSFNL
ncbi:MAG: shikimate kinase, partial [Eubacteriales bacterium]